MSRGGSEKGAEADWGSAEKRGESIVILNRKYSGIKPKTESKSGSNQMYDVPKMVHKNGCGRGHKKRLQLVRIKDLISTVTASGAIFLLWGRKSLRGVTDPGAPYHRTGFR